MLDIVETDVVDNISGKDEPKKTEDVKKLKKPATVEERTEVKKELINKDGEATPTQIKAIKNGLKKLREKDEKYEPYIKECVKKIKAGVAKAEAEDMLIEIGNKIEEQ